MADNTTTETGQVLVIERIFDAPRELVWKAWTEPEHLAEWYGPEGFMLTACEIDLKVGGRRSCTMRSPDGQEHRTTGVHREILPPSRLVYTDCPADERGNVMSASDLGMEGDGPFVTLVTVTLDDVRGKTKMTMRHEGLPAGPPAEGASQGWTQSFDKLAAHLAAA